MDKPRYTVEIIIAAPGTPLVDRDGNPIVVAGVAQTSAPGHMFYVLHGPKGDSQSFGFAPVEHGSMNGPGKVSGGDASEYKDPHYSRTLEISEEQFKKLEAFGLDAKKHGFAMDYEDVRNNCVDFTWAALNHAGIQRKASLDLNGLGIGQIFPDVRIPLGSKMDGKDAYRPMRNIHGVDSIDPPFPDSELNQRRINPMPRRSLEQLILSEADDVGARSADHLARHGKDPLFLQIDEGVARLYSGAGRTFDGARETTSASLYALAKANGITQVDHVLLSERTVQGDAGKNIFIVQGELNDPAHRRASIAAEVAAQTPAETSFARAEELSQVAQARSQEELQQRQVQEQSAPRMG